MRIAFVVNNYPPRTGGVELHVLALVQELRRLGHEPLVVTLESEPSAGERDGIPVIALREHFRVADILGFPSLGTRARLSRLLRDRGVDVVSVHTRFFPMSYVGYRAAKRSGIPVIHTEHGSGHVESDSAVISLASRFVDLTVGRIVLRGAQAVLGVSEEVCAFVKRLAGVDAELFYNAIHLGQPADEPAPERSDRLVFVGRLVPGKGWDTFLDVVTARRAAGYRVDAHLVGDGPDMPALLQRLDASGLAGEVTVHGRVSQAEVREILGGATLVNPTVLSEGFQTTLIEAVAERGRVATYPVPGAARLRDQGAPVRIAEDRTAAALVRTLEALEREAPPAAPRALVEEWGWERRAEQYLGTMLRLTS